MNQKLPFIEISCYFLYYIGMLCYLLYSAYEASQVNTDMNRWLTNGWSIIGLWKDSSDVALGTIEQSLLYVICYAFIHYILAEFVKMYNNNVLPYYYILFSSVVLGIHFTFKPLILLAMQAVLNLLVSYYGNTFWILIYCTANTISVHYGLLETFTEWVHINDFALPFIHYIFMWNMLRPVSYAIDSQKLRNGRNTTCKDLIQGLGYLFYFPTLCGPLLLYEDFEKIYKKKCTSLSYIRLLKITLKMIKYWTYMIITYIMQHFIYNGLINEIPHIQISYEASLGLYVWATLQFMMMHIILYGFACTFADAEDIKVGSLPRCVLTITLYSEMWQFFDQFLYRFIKRYIYLAYIKYAKTTIKRLMGGLLTFTVINIWHGLELRLLIWCTLNYIEFILELSFFKNNMSRRIRTLVASLLCMFSLISQYFLFSNYETAIHQLNQMLLEPLWKHAAYLMFIYSGTQVVTEIGMRTNLLKDKTRSVA